MNQFEIAGRKGTIQIFTSVLLLSLFTILPYQIETEFADTKKLFQQIFRFGLTILLMYFLFRGKNWAKIVLTILFSVAVLLAFVSLFTLPAAGKIPASVMILIYGIVIYHLNFSVYFKAYFNYLQRKNKSF
jgi:hypothetical protein